MSYWVFKLIFLTKIQVSITKMIEIHSFLLINIDNVTVKGKHRNWTECLANLAAESLPPSVHSI